MGLAGGCDLKVTQQGSRRSEPGTQGFPGTGICFLLRLLCSALNGRRFFVGLCVCLNTCTYSFFTYVLLRNEERSYDWKINLSG